MEVPNASGDADQAAVHADTSGVVRGGIAREKNAKAVTLPAARSSCRLSWKLLIGTAVALMVGSVLVVLFVLPLDLEIYQAVVSRAPVVLYLHGYLEQLLDGRIVGPSALYKRQLAELAVKEAEQDALMFARLLSDPTFTRFENSRIFFRPLRRRLPATSAGSARSAADAPGSPRTVWAMAEVSTQDTTEVSTATGVDAGEHGFFNDSASSLHLLRCVGQRTTVTYKGLYYSSYGSLMRSTALNIDHFPVLSSLFNAPCEHHIALFMCVGDAWEIACPPEAQARRGGDPRNRHGWGRSAQEPSRLGYMIIRLRVDDVNGPDVANYSVVEEELAYRVLEPGQATHSGDDASQVSPSAPFRRMDMYRKVVSNPYRSVFVDFPT